MNVNTIDVKRLERSLAWARARRVLPEPSQRRNIRKAAGLSAEDVAIILKTKAHNVYGWETGRCRPRRDLLVRYVELLHKLAVA